MNNAVVRTNGSTEVETIRRHGLVPENMGQALQLAEMMASSKFVPQDFRKNPADCLLVIQQAVRWDMDPFAVMQECSVIQGKLMHSGKLVAAVVNARGNLVERLSFEYHGTGNDRSITVRGRMRGETSAREVIVSLKDAKTNAKVWQTQPDQQLMYHGSRVWARRHTPELMLGVWAPEEFDERPSPHDIVQPGDYDDGIPEKHTKPKEEPKFSRADAARKENERRYEEMRDDMVQTESEPALRIWREDNAMKIAALGDLKEKLFEDFKGHLAFLRGPEVVIEPEPQQSISQRAIDKREKKLEEPSADDIAEYLRT